MSHVDFLAAMPILLFFWCEQVEPTERINERQKGLIDLVSSFRFHLALLLHGRDLTSLPGHVHEPKPRRHCFATISAQKLIPQDNFYASGSCIQLNHRQSLASHNRDVVALQAIHVSIHVSRSPVSAYTRIQIISWPASHCGVLRNHDSGC
jgi:hypothetical protein